jgi:glycosyltransferase involved in cell wall biosynthesis
VPNFIAADASLSPRGAGSHFLFVGKLEALKGVDILLDAAEHVKGAPILLVGACDDPGLRERLGRLPANVRYLGPKTREEIDALLVDARALVLPSLCYENQPMTILEAFAAGVPVIGSCIGGIPELVAHKERGLLVEPGSALDLANAISQLDREPAKACEFGRAGHQYVVTHHSVAGHLEAVSDIYEHAVGSVEQPRAAIAERQPSWI